ncbi:MAG TPA: LacI family DNA-binding transcriptional regulator [Acidobacteriaceae bacterium]
MPVRRKKNGTRRSERVDIYAVAKRARVSVATVSRTINRIPTVNRVYSDRVWKAIDELGYIPNTQARALVSGRSRLIGVIISDITNPFFPELIQSFEDEAIDANYEIMIGSTAYDSRRMEVCIDRMLRRNVDAVAVMTFGIEEPLLGRLAAQNIPLVFIDLAPKGPGMSAITVDYGAGIRDAVQHLVRLGHRKVAFIAGPEGLHSAERRKAAFLEAAKEFNLSLPASSIYAGDHTLESGIAGMRSFLKRDDVPTAILCSNDMTAIGVLHAAAEAKLRIPGDLSVVGFDDIHIARFTVPPLTTIRMSCQQLAHSAFRALRSHLEDGFEHWPRSLDVTTTLTVRESTSAPRAKRSVGLQSAAKPRTKSVGRT